MSVGCFGFSIVDDSMVWFRFRLLNFNFMVALLPPIPFENHHLAAGRLCHLDLLFARAGAGVESARG